jgi:hypothetical protein
VQLKNLNFLFVGEGSDPDSPVPARTKLVSVVRLQLSADIPTGIYD